MRTKIAAMLAGSSLLALASPALAQPAQQTPAASEETGDEIVVTGTFIRGIAPTGNQALGLTTEDIQAVGGTSTNDVLASIPQLSMFNNLNQVGLSGGATPGTANQNTNIQIQRPTLRNVGTNTAGSTPTLLLMDGHRMTSVGVNQASPDAGVIPPSMLERVEVVTDGGSALYGTDAVGGVINFITRSSFDGVRIGGHYSFGDEYNPWDVDVTVGKDWGSGSAYIAYARSEADPVFGYDRDWVSNVNWNPLSPNYLRGELRNCASPNVQISGTNYAVTGPTTIGPAGSINYCDASDYQTISPDSESNSYFAGFSQELMDGIDFNLRGYFTERFSLNGRGPQGTTVRVDDETPSTGSPGQSPYYVDVPGALPNGAIQSILFDMSPFNGTGFEAGFNNTELWVWQITPAFTIEMPGDWQANVLASYGESETFFQNHELNASRAQYYAAGGAAPTGVNTPALTYNTTVGATGNNINPYNVGASNPAVLADIVNWQRYGWSRQVNTNYRAVFDGPLVTLPGGPVRAALGAEYLQEEIERRTGTLNFNAENTLPVLGTDRDVMAFFGELNIPIVGSGNRLPLVESLTLSLSARRDDYSDFGETTNPQIGLVWEPVEWLAIRATWGESFNAPSAVEVLDKEFPLALVSTINPFQWGNLVIPGLAGSVTPPHTSPFRAAPVGTPCVGGAFAGQSVCTASVAAGQNTLLTIGGASADLQPQTGETYSIGFDAWAPFLPNLRLSATYYRVEFENTLSSFANVSFSGTQNNYNIWNSKLLINGTDGSGPNGAFTTADVLAFCSRAPNASDCNAIAQTPEAIYFIGDTGLDNFGGTIQEGVDVSMRYSHDFDWGTWDASISGNYRINAETRTPGTTIWNKTNLDNGSRYNLSINTGVAVGDFYARATMSYSPGWNVTSWSASGPFDSSPNPGNPAVPQNQARIDSFAPVDLFLRYNFGEVGLSDNLMVTLNIDNVFDDTPSGQRTTGTTGFANGNTFGRVFTVGFQADF